MSYKVKELYYTIQGEGLNIGRPAVFCRFSKCNLWSGREEDRLKAICTFCDTDFFGEDGENGGTYQTAEALALAVNNTWPNNKNKFVVFTGGEPMLQLDDELLTQVKDFGFEIAIETNGTIAVSEKIDWITVSPKSGSKLVQKSGSELKIVYPQDLNLNEYEDLDFNHFLLSPMITGDSKQNSANVKLVTDICLANPKWRMTYQCHKIWGIS